MPEYSVYTCTHTHSLILSILLYGATLVERAEVWFNFHNALSVLWFTLVVPE